MAEQTDPIEPDSAPPASAVTPVAPASAPSAPAAVPVARRSVTLPVLPLAIVGGVIVALLFFGGGVAIGYGVASHDGGRSTMQQYRGGDSGNGFGDRNGFAPGQNQGGQNQGGQNGPTRPGGGATTAPRNG